MIYFIPLLNVILGIIIATASRMFFDAGNTLMGILMIVVIGLIILIECIYIAERYRLQKEIMELEFENK